MIQRGPKLEQELSKLLKTRCGEHTVARSNEDIRWSGEKDQTGLFKIKAKTNEITSGHSS